MNLHEIANQKKRKVRTNLLVLLVCTCAQICNLPQLSQATDHKEMQQAQAEQNGERALLDVIKESQSQVDYIPFDFFFNSRAFEPTLARAYLYSDTLSEEYRYGLTYERYRLFRILIDVALNATPNEFIEALDSQGELTTQGQALLMLALYEYERAYRSALFDFSTGKRINSSNVNIEKSLSDDVWKKYEEYLISHIQSQEIVYEPLVCNEDDRIILAERWNDSIRWSYANLILAYPDQFDEFPLEAYALNVCQEDTIEDILAIMHEKMSASYRPSGSRPIYSFLGRAPKELSHVSREKLENTVYGHDKIDQNDLVTDSHNDPWSYNASAITKVTGDKEAEEMKYLYKYVDRIRNHHFLNLIEGAFLRENDHTCEQQVTLGEVAKLLLNARTRFQSREDFERIVGTFLQESRQ